MSSDVDMVCFGCRAFVKLALLIGHSYLIYASYIIQWVSQALILEIVIVFIVELDRQLFTPDAEVPQFIG